MVQVLLLGGASANQPQTRNLKTNAVPSQIIGMLSEQQEQTVLEMAMGIISPLTADLEFEVAQLLLNERPKVRSPLRTAVENGAHQIVDILLHNGANPYDHDIPDGPKPCLLYPGLYLLHVAIEKGNVDVVSRLLAAGVAIVSSTLPFAIKAAKEEDRSVVNVLLQAGALEKTEIDVLLKALEKNDGATAATLITHGAKVEERHEAEMRAGVMKQADLGLQDIG